MTRRTAETDTKQQAWPRHGHENTSLLPMLPILRVVLFGPNSYIDVEAAKKRDWCTASMTIVVDVDRSLDCLSTMMLSPILVAKKS